VPEANPAIRYLFRYRDLSADTLPEHRAIIDDQGACWWGWWKRPTESGRTDVWEALEAELTQGQPVVVGLFDTGHSTVHLATINQIVRPAIDDFGMAQPVTPPAEEIQLIPEYYRSSKHSRAWLRMTQISTDPVDFFGAYSYRVPPPLPQHTPAQLAKLANKRVTDADELRAMDTTIWEVRPAHAGDSTDRFIVASQVAEAPLSARAIECPGQWILHLTDPHYAVEPHREQHKWRLDSEGGPDAVPTLADAIAEAINREGRKIGGIIVTGDLTFNGAIEEFNAAAAGLRKLTDGLLGLGMEHLVVVPGNHDIRWTTANTYVDGADVNVASPEATANYRAFYEKLFRFEASAHLSMARRFLFPGGTLVDVVAVNSSSLEQGEHHLAGMGRVQEVGYREATNALGWINRGASLRVLALHHHLALTDNLESADEYRSGFGIAIDAPRTQRMAAKDGVQLALHGHKHRAFVWRSGAYELPDNAATKWDLGSINIVGGGSAGSTSTDGDRNFFNLLRYSGGKVELEIYRSEHGGSFDRMSCWEAKVTASDDGVPVLEAWQKV
jgi:hypothetical protein